MCQIHKLLVAFVLIEPISGLREQLEARGLERWQVFVVESGQPADVQDVYGFSIFCKMQIIHIGDDKNPRISFRTSLSLTSEETLGIGEQRTSMYAMPGNHVGVRVFREDELDSAETWARAHLETVMETESSNNATKST